MIDDRDNDATDGVPEAPGAEEAADVGYGRPPRSHRFKPGRSGNTRGRPKGARGRRSMVERVLFERRSVDLDGSGRLQKTTTLELVVLALRQRALEGDNRAFIPAVISFDSWVRVSAPTGATSEMLDALPLR